MNNKDIEDIFYRKCREKKIRITPQRIAIFKSLAGDRSHPTAEMVFRKIRKEIPNISFDTINRTLLSFVNVGLLKIIETQGQPRRFDPDLKNHHHFQCLKCNKIIDFVDPALDRIKISAEIQKKVVITDKRIVLTGFCDSCKNKFF